MQVKSALALAAAAAVGANAFVIVPEITSEDSDLISILPVEVEQTSKQSINLPCPNCPVLAEDGVVSTEAKNHLELDFTIDGTPGYERLLVNDFEIYPNPDPFSGDLFAPQVLDKVEKRGMGHMGHMGHMMHPEEEEEGNKGVHLGYRIQAYPITKEEEDQVLELVGVDLQIIEVGGTIVDGLESVQVRLLKNGDSLAIAKIEVVEPKKPECESFWCKMKEMMHNGLGMLKKPCAGKMGHGMMHGKPQDVSPEEAEGMPMHHGHHDHHGHHGGHHGHPGMEMHGEEGHIYIPGHGHPHHHGGEMNHMHSNIFAVILSVITGVIIPILIGIVAGIAFTLILMVISILLAAVINLFRGKKPTLSGCPFRRACHKTSAEEAVVTDEEKLGLVDNQEHQDPPPSYEDTPRS